jgi:seryl-tRNA synthetase
LEQEIQSLKSRKKEVEKDHLSEKIVKEHKRNKIEKEVKRLIDYNKELYTRKVKASNQFNYYEQREIQLKQQIQKEAERENIEHTDTGMQTPKVVPVEFRKEWVGKSDGLPFNDADHLEFRGECLIKAVTVYKMTDCIVWTKFHYESP